MTAQTVSSAVEKRDTGPIGLMWSRKRHFDAVLPASVDVTAFLGTAAGALYANARLMEAAETTPDSLIIALMECAALGHMPGTEEYYLTPRRDKGRWRVLGIEGYRGVIERMYRSGAVQKVVVREVCARDPFGFREGEMDIPLHDTGHKPGASTGAEFFGADGSRNRGEMVGVYAYARLIGSVWSRVALLDRGDVHAARAAGGWKADDQFSPWNRLDGGDGRPELTGRSMWWKTAAHRLEPWVPTSREYRADMLRASAAAAELAARPRGTAVPALPSSEPEPVDAEIVDDGTSDPVAEPEAGDVSHSGHEPGRAVTAQDVNDQFRRLGFGPRDVRKVLSVASALAGRKLAGGALADFTGDQLAEIHARLARCQTQDDLGGLLARIAESRGDDAGQAAAERAFRAGEDSG